MFRVRNFVLSVCAVALLTTFASAQDAPKAEVYGGYSAAFTQDIALPGFQTSVAGNVNNWFGVVAEFGGAYHARTRDVILGGPTIKIKSTLYTYLFGPRFSRRGSGRVTPFAQSLFGGLHARREGENGGLSEVETANGFAMALGGGVDVKLSKRFALRVIQADYLLFRVDGETTNNVRLSAGVVIRF
jgi:hypothetical protein